MSLVENAAAFICMRLAIGFGLATFVSNQYWTSAMFTPGLVGIANAVAGGWGNAGELVSSCKGLVWSQLARWVPSFRVASSHRCLPCSTMKHVLDHLSDAQEWSTASLQCCSVYQAAYFPTSKHIQPQCAHTSRLCTGGGVTQIVIPYITFGLAHHHPLFVAWRYTFLIPACLQIIMAVLILLLGQVRP